MAGRIPQAFIDDLIGRADIVEVINARVPLKRAGREYRANCPFHNEKTPSFWVSPAKQFYHCFGCGAHGTVVSFLMNYDRLSFVEAVEDLAQRLGLEVPREGGERPDTPSVSEDLYSLMTKVATFYQEQLDASDTARDYAKKRGLTRDIATRFAIGYAPDSWNEVLKRFGASEASRAKLLELGLIRERDKDKGEGHYDYFRDRLMFPIRDQRGRVIGFGGRVLDAGEPKYLNSPETALFHKGRELYGLYEVRQDRAPLTRLIVVEGYMDVVRLHQAGVGYAVATLGTSTTPEHLKRAFRLVREIIFCFDGDKAGRAAAWRALNNALSEAQAGRELKFLFLPEGEDPDSLVGKEGKAAFEERFGGALPLSEYLVAHLTAAIDVTHADGKARFVAEARPLLERVPAGPYRELLLDRLAEAIGVNAERFLSIVGPMSAPAGAQRPMAENPATRQRTAISAGRSGQLRQAVKILLHAPGTAAHISAQDRSRLDEIADKGVDVLRELLDALHERPAATTAQLLERWRDTPIGARLDRLAMEPLVLEDAQMLVGELVSIVRHLALVPLQAELEVLHEQAKVRTLSQPETQRLNELLRLTRRG